MCHYLSLCFFYISPYIPLYPHSFLPCIREALYIPTVYFYISKKLSLSPCFLDISPYFCFYFPRNATISPLSIGGNMRTFTFGRCIALLDVDPKVFRRWI